MTNTHIGVGSDDEMRWTWRYVHVNLADAGE